MADLSNFYDDVFPFVPDCSEAVVKHAIRRSLIEFLRSSLVWEEETTAGTTATSGDYQVSTSVSVGKVVIVHVFYVVGIDSNGTETVIYPSTSFSSTLYDIGYSSAERFEFIHPDIIRIKPTPDTDYASLKTKVALTLGLNTTYSTVPDEVLHRYGDFIPSGALMRLMSMPKKPYTDIVEASKHRKDFQRGIKMARLAALKNNTPSVLMVDLPTTRYAGDEAVNQ